MPADAKVVQRVKKGCEVLEQKSKEVLKANVRNQEWNAAAAKIFSTANKSLLLRQEALEHHVRLINGW